ncbi:hypothetical protein H5410_053667 [Solanum commersonii]|uniref:Uncharacterized protein n=1 Tax=Solanum commersonii TaxID=4109 RepID=A0A9J5X7V1_SOLCO|nr:hypothetical protein H5410_053667 [Solanum commersonii]
MKNTFAEILLVDNNATTITHCATIRNEKTWKNNSNLEKFFDNLFVSFRKHIDMNVVIASKDSIKDEFRAYLLLEAHKRKIKSIERSISCVVTNMNTNTKVLEQFMNMVINKSDWNKHINLRKKYSKLKKLVQETGGKVVQFSDTLAQMTGIAAILRFPIPNIDDLVFSSIGLTLIDNNSTTITHCATRRNEKTLKNNSNLEKIFDNLFVSFRKHIDMNVIPHVVIASEDSIKDDFRAYLLLEENPLRETNNIFLWLTRTI